MTRSPSDAPRTSAPSATTVPASSWPGTCGGVTSGSWPIQACQSERQMPVAATSTTTPSGGGAGSGTSSTASGPPNSLKIAARIEPKSG